MKKGNELLTIGAVAVVGYLVYRYLSGSASDLFGGAGAPSGVVGGNTTQDNTDNGYAGGTNAKYTGPGSNNPQAWYGGVYGGPGQPSLTFMGNTANQALHIQQKGGAATAAEGWTVKAAQAIGSAPPRVVAKIKAGRIY